MEDQDLYTGEQKSEQIQHIIERMPNKFGYYTTYLLIVIFIAMIIAGWMVRYPDMVNGEITLNSNSSPLKLIANASGKLKLNFVKSMDLVKEGAIIGYIENPTNPKSIIYVDSILKLHDPNSPSILKVLRQLPSNYSLGELNSRYYTFINSLQNFRNYKEDDLIGTQSDNQKGLLAEQKTSMETAKRRVDIANRTLKYAHKFYFRDSILFLKRVISESEFDKTEINYIAAKDALQSAINNRVSSAQAMHQITNKIQELDIQSPEKEKELKIAYILAYNDLLDNIKLWEQKYVFKAPFSGKVQFLKFYNNNQFVQNGEQLFTIIPKETKIIGQVIIPARGSGKVKAGQEVIIKMENYPYLEYGSITGKVQSVALSTNTLKTEKSEIETYMVLVDFPKQLITNYGAKLDFRAESKGTAEIITNDRKLIERLFDNLKYAAKN